MVQRGGGVKTRVLEQVNIRTIESQIVNNVKLGSAIHTDDCPSYGHIGKFFPHETVNHSRGEYVRGGTIHSNTVESFWALFKRGYHGIYHQMSRKHLQRYLDEFTYRYERRENALDSVFADTLGRVAARPVLPYNVLTERV